MTEQRKNAYRWLLYRAMLDIRTLCQSRGAPTWNPAEWFRQYHRSRFAGALGDWLHNLALYSAYDFYKFDEAQIWREYEGLNRRFPAFSDYEYQREFDDFLNGKFDGYRENPKAE